MGGRYRANQESGLWNSQREIIKKLPLRSGAIAAERLRWHTPLIGTRRLFDHVFYLVTLSLNSISVALGVGQWLGLLVHALLALIVVSHIPETPDERPSATGKRTGIFSEWVTTLL